MSVSAQDLLTTHVCSFPGCPHDARDEGGWCDEGHMGERPLAVVPAGRITPGSLAHLSNETPEPIAICKRPGCAEPSLGARKGPYHGLCAEHTEIARAERKGKAKKRAITPPGTPVVKPSNEEAKPEARPLIGEPGALVQLAQAVEDADRAFAVAFNAQEDAHETFVAAVKALVAYLSELAGEDVITISTEAL